MSVETRPTAIRRFEALSRADVAYAGGKGANLGELTAAGLEVPPGFVIGAPAYAEFRDGSGLLERIEAVLAGVDIDDANALLAAADELRRLIESQEMPTSLEGEIRAAYADLAGNDLTAPVAVRSSATAEDTEAASFAGMNETFLNVRGSDAVVDAVRRCWSSTVRGTNDLRSRQARLRTGRHGHRRRRAASDTGCTGGRDVHDRPGDGRDRQAGHRGGLRPRRVGRERRRVA